MIYMRNITITTAKSATYLENVGFDSYLIPPATFDALREKGPLPLAIETDFDRHIEERRARLDTAITEDSNGCSLKIAIRRASKSVKPSMFVSITSA